MQIQDENDININKTLIFRSFDNAVDFLCQTYMHLSIDIDETYNDLIAIHLQISHTNSNSLI